VAWQGVGQVQFRPATLRVAGHGATGEPVGLLLKCRRSPISPFWQSRSMSLLPVTQDVLRAVEDATGRPVIVRPDAALGTLLAKITIARGPAPAHVVAYNPAAGADYVICLQCGFLLRMFQIPESERFAIAASARGRREVEEALDDHFRNQGMPLPKQALGGIRDQFLGGLIQQLRSMPIGLRVDSWIRENYPSLEEQQKQAVKQQLNDNAQTLGPHVRQLAPANVFRANVGMNSAFALFWSRALGDPLLGIPYKASGHLATGEELLRTWDQIPSDAAHDKKLIESWGSLGLGGWYDFVPYS